ncbi:hypothetical protein HPB51_006420 [Rhipicephalus microplus]|uniref:Uncharacterized protein n=1 Tax=Rhipicephalus microplus TaxID=6941 RepID=A0A9J6EZH2_RHIMP|nr:hypothetical protein HPB51_006420 [Rhipicephalus microplus]
MGRTNIAIIIISKEDKKNSRNGQRFVCDDGVLHLRANGFIFRFVYIVVSGMSLCADIMLYTAVSSGTKIIKKMKVALCVKLFVIAMDFFTPPMHNYNCCQDYLKSDPPRDDVLTAGIVLYKIHDFYEGVRQQGTMATQGLLDTDDLQKQQQQPNVVQVVQVMPGAYPGGGMLVMGAPIAPGAPQVMTAQGVQIDGQTFVPYPPAGAAAYPGGMLFVPHPPPR